MNLLAIVGVIVVGLIVVAAMNHAARKRHLLAKYKDAEIVDAIMRHRIWQGQTVEQLVDSIGRPLDVDQKVLKTKTKEVLKYNRTGKNRFTLRVTVENGVVVGWDKK